MMSLKQEKQGRTRKKQEKTSKKQELAFENKKSKTPIPLFEAKRQVFSLIQQEWNYREISQVSFLIEGLGMKRFSISEISKIKNEFLGSSHNDENNSENYHHQQRNNIEIQSKTSDIADPFRTDIPQPKSPRRRDQRPALIRSNA